MFKFRSLAGVLLIVTVLFAQVGTVFAAPPAQETTPVTGTVTAVDTEADSNGVTTAVLVTLDTGTTYRISIDTAVALGLATVDPNTNEVTLIDLSQSTEPVIVTIDPTQVIPDEEQPEEPVHPIAAILATFFGEDASVINGYHEDGYGFGVITQALWIAQGLEEDNADITAGLILQAKRDKDFSAFVLPDGSTPTNWGQFKNAALGKDKKNLGVIVSGHAENGEDDTTILNSQQQQHGNGKDENKNEEQGNGKGKGNGHGNPNKP